MIHYLAHLFGDPCIVPVRGTFEGDRRTAFAMSCPTCHRLNRPHYIGGARVEEPETLTWRKLWGNEIVEVRRG